MKIRIIKEGLFGNPELKVGMIFSLNGHPPAGWAGFYEVVSDDKTEGKEAVTNPKRGRKAKQDPLDHDGDGRKGGSLPKSEREPKAEDGDTEKGDAE